MCPALVCVGAPAARGAGLPGHRTVRQACGAPGRHRRGHTSLHLPTFSCKLQHLIEMGYNLSGHRYNVEDLRWITRVGPGRKCSKYQMMDSNSRIEGLKCVEGHFEHFLPGPSLRSLPRALRGPRRCGGKARYHPRQYGKIAHSTPLDMVVFTNCLSVIPGLTSMPLLSADMITVL